jgi:hypothetical protein
MVELLGAAMIAERLSARQHCLSLFAELLRASN